MTLSKPKIKRPCPVHTEGLLDDDDEDRLAKKLFGDKRETVGESSSDDDEDMAVEKESHPSSSAVWCDEDDAVDEIQIPSNKTAVLLKRSGDSGGCIPSDEYQNRLRKAFQRQQYGTPKWAMLESKKSTVQSKGDDSETEVEAVFDEMTRSSIRYVEKDPLLVKDVVHTFRWPDITVGYHDSRPLGCVLFHHVRPVVITGGASGKVQLFRVGDKSEAGNFLQNVRFTNFPITSMSLLQGGCSVVCGSTRQEYLMKYDLEQGVVTQLRLPKCVPNQNIGRFAVSRDGSLLAMIARNAQVYVLSSSVKRGEVIIWQLQGFQHVFRDEGAVRGTKIRLSTDGSKVACGSNTGIVNLYEVADVRNSSDPKPRTVVSNLVTSCDSIAFSHDSQAMAFSSNVKKNQVKLLHVASNTVFNNFPKKHEKMSNVDCVEFSPHSGYLGIGCGNGQLILERMNYYEDY
ncbi:hypothetical protein GCK32_009786 [Trichostrongylus colubriformis]|uniref:Uncharacterized protein n=1 Tax=Trichostrongylus colubriformis TaxID=6319 RepID=A0AAN8EWR2_TRICO